ncbi:Splicing factor 3B subunit 1, partial [Geodia barretti]
AQRISPIGAPGRTVQRKHNVSWIRVILSFPAIQAKISTMAFAATHEDIEAQIEEIQARRRAGVAEEGAGNGTNDKVGLNSLGHFDMNVYTSGDKSGYVTSIPANEDEDEAEEDMGIGPPPARATYHAPSDVMADIPHNEQASDPFADTRRPKIIDRHDDYHRRKMANMFYSPFRADPFATAMCW